MKNRLKHTFKSTMRSTHFWLVIVLVIPLSFFYFVFPDFFSSGTSYVKGEEMEEVKKERLSFNPFKDFFDSEPEPFDTLAYDAKLNFLANNPPPPQPTTKIVKDPTTGVETTVTVPAKPAPINLWPVKTVYPNAGAILPFSRVIAFYGNLYSKKMGVLGEYPEEEMLARLETEVKKWEAADPSTPVVPALHYIAVVAQASAGVDGKYRARMPSKEIDKVLAIADKIGAIVFLDIQVGFSTLQTEVPLFEKYLKLPNVHLGVDAEFSMKSGIRPGKVVGTLDASDINFTTEFMAKVAKENNLPPKILVVHRYTQKMITNYKLIKPLPEVQVVMHMDGWGVSAKKKTTYREFVYREPVQFAGFKLFFKNDILTPGTVLMTPEEIIKLRPAPIYIQYQ